MQDEGKASSSEQVPYEDTLMTNAFRAQVRRINQHLKDHPCRYAGQHRINLMHDHVTRIFNNGDWNQGGRLYGYWPMNLPKRERHYLSIGGEPLADLDFGSCFVALLHVHDGTEFDPEAPDPFKVKGYEEYPRHNQAMCLLHPQCLSAGLRTILRTLLRRMDQDLRSWRQMEEVIFLHIPLFQKYTYSALAWADADRKRHSHCGTAGPD